MLSLQQRRLGVSGSVGEIGVHEGLLSGDSDLNQPKQERAMTLIDLLIRYQDPIKSILRTV